MSARCHIVIQNFLLSAKLEGEHFFDRTPRLCQIIASMCTISCVTSLMTIAMMSLNRYIYLCHNSNYDRIFTKRSCILICVSLYSVGLTLVLLNQAGIGDHSFDRKSLECIWDRMATYPFTVVYSIMLVWVPCLVIGVCYFRIYLFLRGHALKMRKVRDRKSNLDSETNRNLQTQVIKSMFIIYTVFAICWAPYALIMVIDVNDSFSHEAHVVITTFAHLHPSVSWLIYYKTQTKFAKAYRQILVCRKSNAVQSATRTQVSSAAHQLSAAVGCQFVPFGTEPSPHFQESML